MWNIHENWRSILLYALWALIINNIIYFLFDDDFLILISRSQKNYFFPKTWKEIEEELLTWSYLYINNKKTLKLWEQISFVQNDFTISGGGFLFSWILQFIKIGRIKDSNYFFSLIRALKMNVSLEETERLNNFLG